MVGSESMYCKNACKYQEIQHTAPSLTRMSRRSTYDHDFVINTKPNAKMTRFEITDMHIISNFVNKKLGSYMVQVLYCPPIFTLDLPYMHEYNYTGVAQYI